MPRSRYILIARVLHWILAIGIIAEIILGLYGDNMPYGAGRAAARATTLYTFHKTFGVVLLAIAIAFTLWMQLGPKRPAPAGQSLERQDWDRALGRLVYWGLLVAIFAIPITGPILHSNGPSWGYAPMFRPFGDRVPGVPESFASNAVVRAFHVESWWLFAGLAIIHVLLWLRRRHLRRHPALRPATLTVDARLVRLAPLGGVLMWLAVAALVA